MKGVCIDTGATLMLRKDETYYLFDHGPNNYYVSRFDNPGAHFGSYQRKCFKLIQEQTQEWPDEPPCPTDWPELSQDRVYRARLIWRRPGYKMTELGFYYIQPKKTHCDFWYDPQLERAGGCFPMHWFSDFVEHTPETIVIQEFHPQELRQDHWQQLNLFDDVKEH